MQPYFFLCKITKNIFLTGVIIGSVIGVVFLILIIIVICVIYREKLKSLCQSNESQPIDQIDDPEAQKLKTITPNE